MAERPKLLLIDDEPALAQFVAEAARLSQFDPIIAHSHNQFRDAYRRERPDMIVLDLGMPGMDGVELLRFLANEQAEAPVLIISGFDRRVLDSAFQLGRALGLTMVGPIAKPARLDDVEAMLGTVKQRLKA